MYHPKTTLRLILYGFGFVALPLVVALVFAVLYMDRLGDQSRTAVYTAVEATRDSRQLTGHITTMERFARQYLVLGDSALLEAYRSAHEDFSATALRLLRYTHDLPQGDQVRQLGQAEHALYERIRADREAIASEEAAEEFAELADRAEAILDGSSLLIDQEVQVLQRTAAEAQRMLFGLAFALIPLSLLSVGVFTALIAHPIRQVDHAIRHLGDGNFDDTISVSGPQDLQFLGRRLDWLRERLSELEQQKSKFLQHISHELKTPLTAIRESTELLADGAVGELSEPQAEIAGILRANARQLQALIEDLLNFGTSQNHLPTLYLSRVELASVVEQVTQNHKPALLSKRIELDSQLAEVSLMADREKLSTVVDNLLSNAIKFTPAGGRIQIRLDSDADHARLTVIDSGPGIPDEEREQVFDAFYQGRQRAGGYVKGSGLGLAIAREYVAAHQGTITVPDHEGPGAKLLVQLPFKPGRQGQE